MPMDPKQRHSRGLEVLTTTSSPNLMLLNSTSNCNLILSPNAMVTHHKTNGC